MGSVDGGRWGADNRIMTKIGILGCAGRMGQMLVRQVGGTAGAELAGSPF